MYGRVELADGSLVVAVVVELTAAGAGGFDVVDGVADGADGVADELDGVAAVLGGAGAVVGAAVVVVLDE